MGSPDNPEMVPESFEDAPNDGVDVKSMSFLDGADFQDVQISSEAGDSIWPEYCNPSYIMPEKIEVKVTNGGESYSSL